jgi:N-methylhydantoinase A/oxoprolinase/acetone carboxylase beta subunit
MTYFLGIDIGGTNTDAVLVNAEHEIVDSVKTATTQDISLGFQTALKKLLTKITPQAIKIVAVGTTCATNAILQRQGLFRVGVMRIAGQKPQSIPVCFGWPTELKKAVFVGAEMISGGFDCQNREITPFKESEARAAILKLLEQGAESLAVVAVFSPMNPEHEKRVQELVHEICGSAFPISLSHSLGGIGFIERENTAILNAALKKVMSQGFQRLEEIKNACGLMCPLYVTQNNGSLITLNQATENPILTISAGPTNSFIGASRLVGFRDAIIVDIGGTSTDIGMMKNGFPKRSLNVSNIGGVRLNFSMPDVLSIALGGGSFTSIDESSSIQMGPLSVGKDLFKQAKSFGGSCLTFTDVALKEGYLQIEGATPSHVNLTKQQTNRILEHVLARIQQQVKLMGGNCPDLPVVLVGGGAHLLPANKLEPRFVVPQYAHVANAYGAALGEVVGTVDQVVSLIDRELILNQLQRKAIEQAVLRGADAKSVKVIEIEIIPYHYTTNNMARLIVTASGKLKGHSFCD